MENRDVSRRRLLKGSAVAGLSLLQVAGPARLLFGQSTEEVIPWLDQPASNPVPQAVGNLLRWESLNSWYTPTQDFFFVSHYGHPNIDPAAWRLEISGLVARPRTLALDELNARARHEVEFTLECPGNNCTGLAFFIGGIGNARWAGARLAPLLRQAQLLRDATEVIFWGADSGTLTIRDTREL